MVVGVGVDFGTSNSTVAWFDGRQVHLVRIDAGGPILPTAVHLDREYAGLTGNDAIERYVQENSARLVSLAPEILGQAGGEIGEASSDFDIGELESARNTVFGPLIDHGLPGRLFLGLKRLLGDPGMERVSVFDRLFRLVALLTPVLLRMREGVQRELAAPLERVHIGRPIEFEGKREADDAGAGDQVVRGIHTFILVWLSSQECLAANTRMYRERGLGVGWIGTQEEGR